MSSLQPRSGDPPREQQVDDEGACTTLSRAQQKIARYAWVYGATPIAIAKASGLTIAEVETFCKQLRAQYSGTV